MISYHRGILLPTSTLSQPWFQIFSLVVAFNTIIYLGLTLSKLLPWPDQIHPRTVRQFFPNIYKESRSDMTSRAKPHLEIDDDFDSMRSQIISSNAPRGFALAGGLIIIIATLTLVTGSHISLVSELATYLIGMTALVASQWFSRRSFSALSSSWTWTALSVVFVSELIWECVDQDQPISLANAIIVMTITPAITMYNRPAIIGGLLEVVLVSAGGMNMTLYSSTSWILVAIGGLGAGLFIMKIRQNVLDQLIFEKIKSNTLATTDPLTGFLNQNGLLTVASSIIKSVEQNGGRIFLARCTINNLIEIKEAFGMEYGDELIEVVGLATKAAMQPGDLIARWESDSFLIMGVGDRPDAADLRHRITEAIELNGIALGKMKVELKVGTSGGTPEEASLQHLLVIASR